MSCSAAGAPTLLCCRCAHRTGSATCRRTACKKLLKHTRLAAVAQNGTWLPRCTQLSGRMSKRCVQYKQTCSLQVCSLGEDEGAVSVVSSSNSLLGNQGRVSQQGFQGFGARHKGDHAQRGRDGHHIVCAHLQDKPDSCCRFMWVRGIQGFHTPWMHN